MFGFPFSHGWPSRFHIWDVILNPLTNSLHHFSRWWNVAPPTSSYIPISPLNVSPILGECPRNFPLFSGAPGAPQRQKTTRPSRGVVCAPPGVWRLTKRRPAPRRKFRGVFWGLTWGKTPWGNIGMNSMNSMEDFFWGLKTFYEWFIFWRIVVEYWI